MKQSASENPVTSHLILGQKPSMNKEYVCLTLDQLSRQAKTSMKANYAEGEIASHTSGYLGNLVSLYLCGYCPELV